VLFGLFNHLTVFFPAAGGAIFFGMALRKMGQGCFIASGCCEY
jgi:hypothetical protein